MRNEKQHARRAVSSNPKVEAAGRQEDKLQSYPSNQSQHNCWYRLHGYSAQRPGSGAPGPPLRNKQKAQPGVACTQMLAVRFMAKYVLAH